MRGLVLLLFVITLSGCSAMMVGAATPASRTAEQDRATRMAAAADAATTDRVKRAFAADAELSQQMIYVSTKAGMVRLSGSVSSYAARENAEKLALATDRVRAVENKITVEFSN